MSDVDDILKGHQETERKIFYGVTESQGNRLRELAFTVAGITKEMQEVAERCDIEGVSAFEIVAYFSMHGDIERMEYDSDKYCSRNWNTYPDLKEKDE